MSPVYVDDSRHFYGPYVICHMVADTTEELLAMATRIGVSPKHIQSKGTHQEHFDICRSMRSRALAAGAKSVHGRDIVAIMRRKESAA